MSNVPNQDKRSKNFIAGIAEIGSRILFFFAKNFPESSHWDLFVLVIVHIAFIPDRNMYRWAESKVSRYFAQKNLTAAIESARKTLDTGLNNPVTTEAHKKILRKQLERLEYLEAVVKMKRVEILAESNE